MVDIKRFATGINMTDFIKVAKYKNKRIIIYPAHEFWMDIGTIKDYQQSKKFIRNLN